MFNKKAQGLSFNFIVVIAIALIVMFVVIGIFTSRASEGDQNLRSCEARGGVCVQHNQTGAAGSPRCPGNKPNEASNVPMIGAHCFGTDNQPDASQTCCVRKRD